MLNIDHKDCLLSLENLFVKQGFIRNKDSFYKEMDNIFAFIKYRKHTIYRGFFLDIGIFFKNLDTYSKVPINEDKWHLIGRLGNFDIDFRLAIQIDRI